MYRYFIRTTYGSYFRISGLYHRFYYFVVFNILLHVHIEPRRATFQEFMTRFFSKVMRAPEEIIIYPPTRPDLPRLLRHRALRKLVQLLCSLISRSISGGSLYCLGKPVASVFVENQLLLTLQGVLLCTEYCYQ